MDTSIDIQCLKDNHLILFEVVSGSRAYGLATKDSDTDIKGVFYLPKKMFYGNEYVGQVNNSTNDIVYYELGKYMELLSRNNPNILEMLCTPDEHVIYKHPLMNEILPQLFLSKLAKETLAGYALTQIKKAKGLNKKFNNPVSEERLTVLDFCYIMQEGKSVPVKDWLSESGKQAEHCGLVKLNHTKGIYALYYDKNAGYKGLVRDENSDDVCCSSVEKGTPVISYLFCNQEAYSAHCKNYSEYWSWVEKRNDNRYRNNLEHGKGYDTKNMMHVIRLLQQAKELFDTGILRINRPNREELLMIKSGEKSYEELLGYAEQLMGEIEISCLVSPLQEKPDDEKVKQLLVELREKLYDNVTTN